MERILLTSAANEAELMRTLAWHGVDTVGLRVMGSSELARLGLISCGKVLKERLCTPAEQTALMCDVLLNNELDFFSLDHNDVQRLCAALNTLRQLISDEDGEEKALEDALMRSEFKEKNEALMQAYRLYMQRLSYAGAIDAPALLRYALKNCPPIQGVQAVILDEYPLTPLEAALADKLSGGSAEHITLAKLFGVHDKKTDTPDIKITAAYGASNEALDILTRIFDSKDPLKLDSCTVAVSDIKLYPQLFFEFSLRYGIPMTFGCGVPMVNTCVAELLKCYYIWQGDGLYGTESLKRLVNCYAFDNGKLFEKMQAVIPEVFAAPKESGKGSDINGPMHSSGFTSLLVGFTDLAGKLRLGENGNDNQARLKDHRAALDNLGLGPEEMGYAQKCAAFTEKVINEFEQGPAYLLENFCKVREGAMHKADSAALSAAIRAIKAYTAAGIGRPAEIIPELLRKNVCFENREAGKLHITAIDRAAFALRDNLFIAGLGANNFPGAPAEDPLILDCDLENFAPAKPLPTSEYKVGRNKMLITALCGLAAGAGCKIYLSYSDLRTKELKDENRSSVIYSIYSTLVKELKPEDLEKVIIKKGYFDDGLTADRLIGQSYNKGEALKKSAANKNAGKGGSSAALSCFDNREYSPSEIETFFYCPRRFYLTQILGIKEPEEEQAFEVVLPNELGIMVHKAMEILANSDLKMTEDKFIEAANTVFDEFIMQKPPVSPQVTDKNRRDYLYIARKAYRADTAVSKSVISAEGSYRATHKATGVRLYGKPDRIEKIGESYVIGDFKTGRTIKHDPQKNIRTCLQAILYAYLTENGVNEDPKTNEALKGIKIDRCEYRYSRYSESVAFDYRESDADYILKIFANALKANYFPLADDPGAGDCVISPSEPGGNCKYCKLGAICGKEKKV